MVNSLYLKLIGNRDVLHRPVAESLPETVAQGYITLLDHVRSSGESIARQGARLDIVWTEGQPPEERYVDFVYHPLREEDGTISGIIAIGLDVTQNKQAEKALLQTEKLAAVGRLAASIAHEINNPLESVTNLLYLARGAETLQEAQNYLNLGELELRRMTAITNQTLSFHKQATRPRPVTCDDLFSSVLSIYQSRINNARVHVARRTRTQQPVLCFDGEIRQVLNNLVSNAIDAMHSSGCLYLRSRSGQHWPTGEAGVILTVADTGPGIPPELRQRIFEPFFTTKGLNGTGLGLWVSHDIVARHHGVLRLRSSQRPGRSGTVFTHFLPFEAVSR
jgi:signal transduction histidine kinase